MAPRWKAFAVVSIAVFMSILDLFIVNIAMPDLHTEFAGTTLSGLSWVLNAYAIVFAALLVPFGKLGDVIGRRRVFRAGLVVFVLGSALAAVSPSIEFLIAARVLQSIGAAAVTPNSLGLILPQFPPKERAVAIGAWAALGGIGAALGPPVGGLLVGLDWRWIFLVNVPFGLLAVYLSRKLEEFRDEKAALPDALSVILLAASVTLLVLGVVEGPTWGWDIRAIGSFVLAVLLGIVFVLRSLKHRSPVLELDMLRSKAFSLASVSALLFYAAFAATLLAGALFLTSVWGYSALQAGFAVAPGPAAAAVFAVVAGKVQNKIGPAAVGLPGGLLVAAGSLWLLDLGTQPDYAAAYLPGQMVIGAGVGLMMPAFTAAAVLSLPPARLATGIGAQTTFRQIGAALGVASWVAVVGTPSRGEAIAAFESGFILIAACAVGAGLAMAPLLGARPQSAPAGDTSAPTAEPPVRAAS